MLQADMEQLDKGLDDQEPSIHQEGWYRLVFVTESALSNLIWKVQRMENLKTKALMLRALVEWQFQDPGGIMVPFNIYTNLNLEEALEKRGSMRIKIYNGNEIVLDQSDSVSSSRIPQRPVDHTTKNDHHLILMMESATVFFLDGNTTRNFQCNLILVPKVFIKEVLEAKHDNILGRNRAVDVTVYMNEHTFKCKYEHDSRGEPVFTNNTLSNPQTSRFLNYRKSWPPSPKIFIDQRVFQKFPQRKSRKIIQALYEFEAVAWEFFISDQPLPNKVKINNLQEVKGQYVIRDRKTQEDPGEIRWIEDEQGFNDVRSKCYEIKSGHGMLACEVGSDKAFVETLLTELHKTASIETELHLRDAVIQVTHQGQKITQEISPEGLQWRHKDDSKKVVATLDRDGKVIIRNEPGSKGEPFFTNERNFLMFRVPRKRFQTYRDSWPDEPRKFIDQNALENFDSQIKQALYELEAMTWAFFKSDQPLPNKVNINNLQELKGQYVLQDKRRQEESNEIRWIEDEQGLNDVLSKCYEIKSGQDVRNVIRHYAKTGENEATYLMVNDWIYVVNPENLYVYLVGKKLDNNQMGNEKKIDEVKGSITEQIKKEKYPDMREHILDKNIENPKQKYAEFVKEIFLGEHTTGPHLSTEAWYTTYFTASVICESARNFRTFPLVLMALDMVVNPKKNIRDKGLNFFFRDHPMARGNSWIDPSRRGFSGSATPQRSSKLKNKNSEYRKTVGQLMNDLANVLRLESDMFIKWKQTMGSKNLKDSMADMAENLKISEDSSHRNGFLESYNGFTEKTERPVSTPSGHDKPSTSGTLGGYEDGHVTLKDLNSASELENSFRLESYFSRASASFSEQIHSQLKAKYGENLAGLHIKEGSAQIENGQFICQLVSKGADAEPVEFRVDLSPESQRSNEIMLKSFEAAVHDMEMHSSQSSHQVGKYVEHTGTAVGTLGLLLGMKGAVRAFEQGDIKDGVVGGLQTAHGVTAMTTSVIAKQALSSETRVARAAATIMRSPAMKGVMTVVPIVGIGFGIYNLEQDLERGDTLGYIDAGVDAGMIALDVLEIAQPELAPFIAPINLALSVVRMAIDDVYMGIEDELNSLPKDAGVLKKLEAVFVGLGKGIEHFAIHVASVFYDWGYDEIEQGHKLVAQISDYHKYYSVTKEQDGTTAVDFTGGASSWNGGGIYFCLADQGQSEFCMDYFVSSDESFGKRCWNIDTQGSKDIILGLGESHQLEYKTLQKKILMFIPAGSVTVVSGYEAVSNSRYGKYKGNRDANRFFAVQKSEDKHVIEVMLSYYYQLYGEPGDDIFFLGPQRSYIEGSGGKDTYIIPDNGGKTIINNYDPSKALDTLHFSVDYSHISVSKSGNDVVFMYEGSHSVTIQNWFLSELYRHMNMMSKDGVLFEISSTVVSSVQLVARGINKMFQTHGETVDASKPLLSTVTNILGTRYDDVLIGNGEKNVIDGGGGEDHLTGGEGEDIYMVKNREDSSVTIENYSRDNKTDLVIIEANLHTFKVRVKGNHVTLYTSPDSTAIDVTLLNWFRSPEDRHLLVITKDLITFTISDNKADCQHSDPFTKCIKSRSIDYSSSSSPLVVDLQEDEALNSVTEVRGSEFNDVIRGNKENNVIVPGRGDDSIQGRGGEDWYVITPGQGVTTINNQSPDLALDVLFLKDQYRHVTCTCEGQSIIILVSGRRNVILQNWFESKHHQHLQIKTSDGITAGLMSNRSSCSTSLIFPITVDYRNQKPEPLNTQSDCFTYQMKNSNWVFCDQQGKVMMMSETDSVREMYGSPGFDIMVGNRNENLLDPYTGDALMIGGEGKDTYIIKHGYGNDLIIYNFAEDQNIDTVLVDMDFIDGGQVTLESSPTGLDVTVTTKGKKLHFTLHSYSEGSQNQHLEFQSSDGVKFKLKSQNSTGDDPSFEIEAFKVTLKQSQMDCRLDLSSQRNLSKVHTVQGCPFQSNDILGNDQNNALIGGWKDDALDGGLGDDTLTGGNGDDLLTGGLGDDTLYGEDGNDTMMGNSGNDVFIPGPGADLVDGGPGRDTVLYRGDHEKGKGVYVNLLSGQGRSADAEGDVLKDVETVIGTIYSDFLVSGYESSLLKGSDGSDILVSTGGYYLVGGDGNDIYMLAFLHGSVTIDNCAKDNAIDVLYLSSESSPVFDCQLLSDRVLLTFFGLSQNAVKIALKGWISDDDDCGHLVLVFRDVKVSVDRLLQECQLRQKELLWSSVITWVICISLVLFHCILMLLMCRKRAQQQKTLKQTERNVEESVDMEADVEFCSDISP